MNRRLTWKQRLRSTRVTILVSFGLASCSGAIDGPGGANLDPSDLLGGDRNAPSSVRCEPSPAVPLTQLVRLTHRQYANTVRDLLRLSALPPLNFIPDSANAGFLNNANALTVTDALGNAYRRSAELLAESATAHPTSLSALGPCVDSGVACAQGFIESFGRRAFRRPLTERERTVYLGLFQSAGELYPGGGSFASSARAVVEAMLQSPQFLYRVEGVDVAATGDALGAYELAARLSYYLWNSMPDDALMDAAAQGRLSDVKKIAAEVNRMLDDPKARDTIADFHAQWLQTDRYANLQPSPANFPDFDPALGPAMQEEARLFVEEIVLREGGGFSDLLTAPFTYVNQGLARLYGVPGNFGDALQRVELDASKRRGLLTQLGFLAANAHTTSTSPILRGVFVQRQVLCNNIPPPQFPVDPQLPEGKTMRERVTKHTSSNACASCHHQVINPAGFAFENYNAAGQYQIQENGETIDASGTLALAGGRTISFASGPEFVEKVAQTSDAQACYAVQWLRYAYGRVDDPSDGCTVRVLTEALGREDYTVKDMLRDLTRTKSFLMRGQ